jgi:hypothetical protein
VSDARATLKPAATRRAGGEANEKNTVSDARATLKPAATRRAGDSNTSRYRSGANEEAP